LGHPLFIHSHLMNIADKFDEWCKGLQLQLDDLQTKTFLFQTCLQGTVPHLLAANVSLQSRHALHPIDPYAWSSRFLQLWTKQCQTFFHMSLVTLYLSLNHIVLNGSWPMH
jgi:hypothetical protein